MKVVAINGSPRPKGNTFQAIQAVLDVIEYAGIETEVLQIGGRDIRGCTACGGCSGGMCVFADEAFRSWTRTLEDADGILLACPVYYAGIPGTMKAFLDRIFYQSGGRFRLKVGASIAVLRRSGGVATFDQLNHYLLISEMIVAPSFYWNVAHGRQPGEVQEDLEALSVLQNLGQNMAYLLEMQNRTRAELPPPAPVARAWTNFIR